MEISRMWKYDHIDETRQRLLEKSIIDLSGEVDEDMIMYLRDAMLILATNNNPDIEIVITSNGGHASIGLNMYDLIRNYSGRTVGKVEGFCKSMATVVLQACDHRVCLCNSYIKIHNVNGEIVSLDVFRDPKRLAKLVVRLEKKQSIIDNIYRSRNGRSLKAIARLSKKDIDLTAEEALEFGLIDEII